MGAFSAYSWFLTGAFILSFSPLAFSSPITPSNANSIAATEKMPEIEYPIMKPIPPFSAILTAAMANSLDAKRALLSREQAQVDKDILAYQRYPQLGMDGTLTNRLTQDAPVGNGLEHRQNYAARLSYSIYDFGRADAQLREAELQEQSSALTLTEVNEKLTWSVAKAYLAAYSSQRLLSISKENLQISAARLAATRDGYHGGLRPENDLVAAEADFGDAKIKYDQAELELEVQIQQLYLMTGSPFSANPTSPNQEPSTKGARTADDWQHLIDSWTNSSPSAAEQRRQADAQLLDANRETLAASKRPKLTAKLSAERNQNQDQSSHVYTGQIQLSWDIPWSGQTRDEEQRIALKRSALDLSSQLETQSRNDARSVGLSRFHLARRQWQSVHDQFQLRERQYQLVSARYRSGKASALELGNVELELGKVRLQRQQMSNAMMDAVLQIAEALRIKDPEVVFLAAQPESNQH